MAKSSASIRSRMPPWPGSNDPESLICAPRFKADSNRSPNCAAAFVSSPKTKACTQYMAGMFLGEEEGVSHEVDGVGKSSWILIAKQKTSRATATLAITLAIAPSHLLLGLTI